MQSEQVDQSRDDLQRIDPPSVPAPVSNLRKLLTLAWPLIIGNSFTTVQILIDRLFLSWYDVDAATASVAANTVFWLPYILLFSTAGYVATFAAQYTGAGRPLRVGPAVWQGLYFSLAAGIGFLCLLPVSDALFRVMGHSANIQHLES